MTIRRMCIACWIPKATTHTQNKQYLLLVHDNNGYVNAPERYVYTDLACLVHFCSGCYVRPTGDYKAKRDVLYVQSCCIT